MTCSGYAKLVAAAVVGALLILLAGISIPLLNIIIHQQVIKKVAIYNGSETYSMWVEPNVPIYLEVYVFDLKNPSEALRGEKPYVQQKGPYTYREHRQKVDIHHHENGTVSYRQIKSYKFDEGRSVGPDTDEFTTINIPFMTFVEYLYWNHEQSSQIVRWLIKIILGESVFITKSVREIVWGYEDRMLSLGKLFDPKTFYTSTAGILAGKNNTDDGTYNIYTGVENPDKLGIINTYNGSRFLSFWSSEESNMVNGTDGSLCPPFIHKEMSLYMFSTDICRSVYGVYSGVVQSPHKMNLWRFRAPPDVLQSAALNPDNAGFCTPPGNCLDTGVLNISECQMLDGFHLPIIASFPHFHQAAPHYQQAVLGLQPHQPDLNVDVDVEPISGIVMHVAKRLQVNIFIRGDAENSQLQSIQTMVYPVLWMNETADIDLNHARLVHDELLRPLQVAHIVQYVMFGVGALLILLAMLTAIYRQWKKRKLHPDEESSGLVHDQDLPQEESKSVQPSAPTSQLIKKKKVPTATLR